MMQTIYRTIIYKLSPILQHLGYEHKWRARNIWLAAHRRYKIEEAQRNIQSMAFAGGTNPASSPPETSLCLF